jgi:glutathione S-transferase
MHDIILHNYPQSPVAEKVRTAFGFKNLTWKSVAIPRIPPKPKLTAMTGGYRRTPVMQIGADIFCDSRCILRAIEYRMPDPTLFPEGSSGFGYGLSRWLDGTMFDLAVKLVLSSQIDDLDPDFAADRGRLYLGPDWAEGLRKANADLPHLAAQMRGQLGWLETVLGDGRAFLTGDTPGYVDALAYHVVWFIRGRWTGGATLLSEFSSLEAWEARVQEIGHGTVSDLDADAALEIACNSEPATQECEDPNDPQGLKVGMGVSVGPDLDGGEQNVTGTVQAVNRDIIAINRNDDDLGALCVHFPRVAYKVVIL